MQTTEIRTLRCDLEEHEMVERSLEQNQLMLEVVKLEAERRAINVQIKPREERIDDLRVIILNGYEERDVDCYWRYEWDIKIKFLHRCDNDAIIEQQPIREHEKQTEFPLVSKAPEKVTPLFEPCPSGPCVMVKTGHTCAPAFCGKTPPAQSSSKQLSKIDAATCEHPIDMRFQDSNALVCEACGTVIDTFSTDPVEIATKLTIDELVDDLAALTSGETALDLLFEDTEKLEAPAPDKDRACCYPKDRVWATIGKERVLYCKHCLLIHRKTANDKEVPFVAGEKVVLPAEEKSDLDAGWPDPPKVAA